MFRRRCAARGSSKHSSLDVSGHAVMIADFVYGVA